MKFIFAKVTNSRLMGNKTVTTNLDKTIQICIEV